MSTSNRIQLLRALENQFVQSERSAREAALGIGIELGLNELELKMMRTESLIHAVVFRLEDVRSNQVENKLMELAAEDAQVLLDHRRELSEGR